MFFFTLVFIRVSIMANETGEVVLVTGGSGFIGQHIIKMLLKDKSQLNIKEVRSVDLKAFKNTIDG